MSSHDNDNTSEGEGRQGKQFGRAVTLEVTYPMLEDFFAPLDRRPFRDVLKDGGVACLGAFDNMSLDDDDCPASASEFASAAASADVTGGYPESACMHAYVSGWGYRPPQIAAVVMEAQESFEMSQAEMETRAAWKVREWWEDSLCTSGFYIPQYREEAWYTKAKRRAKKANKESKHKKNESKHFGG